MIYNIIKKYGLYFLFVIFGIIFKNLFKEFDNYSFGFLIGGISVIPLWLYYYKYRK